MSTLNRAPPCAVRTSTGIKMMLPYMLIFGFFFTVVCLTKDLVEEKESRLKVCAPSCPLLFSPLFSFSRNPVMFEFVYFILMECSKIYCLQTKCMLMERRHASWVGTLTETSLLSLFLSLSHSLSCSLSPVSLFSSPSPPFVRLRVRILVKPIDIRHLEMH